MRKEASISLWKSLYNVAAELKELEPWKDIWDMDVIAIQEREEEEPIFCTILGKGGSYLGVAMYEGTDGLASFQAFCDAEENSNETLFAMYEQNALVCHWGPESEVPEQQKAIARELNLQFDNKNEFPGFLSWEPRFMPYTPDEDQVQVMIATFIQLIEAIKAIRENRIQVNFEDGEFLLRYFDEDQMMWYCVPAQLPYVEMAYPTIEITDELALRRMQNRPQSDAEIMLDFFYLGVPVEAEDSDEWDKPINPLILMAYNPKTKEVLTMEMVEPDQDLCDAAMCFVYEYVVGPAGRMKQISVKSPWLMCGLEDVCAKCNIELLEKELPTEEMLQAMMAQTDI